MKTDHTTVGKGNFFVRLDIVVCMRLIEDSLQTVYDMRTKGGGEEANPKKHRIACFIETESFFIFKSFFHDTSLSLPPPPLPFCGGGEGEGSFP